MNNIEIEAKILNIKKDDLRAKLKNMGATLVFSERKFSRVTFDNDNLRARNAWIRIRNEGDKVTMSFKQVADESRITGTKEIELEIDSFDKAEKFLTAIGFTKKYYQENLREEWQADRVKFDIDTWPMIPSFLEIEGEDEEVVKSWFGKLGFDYKKAVFGSSDIIYKKFYNIDIFKIPNLTFGNYKNDKE